MNGVRTARLSIEDVAFEKLGDSVDFVVAASGYEPRCTHVVERIHQVRGCSYEELGRRLAVLRFKTLKDLPTRLAADQFFDSYETATNIEIGTDDGLVARQLIAACVHKLGMKNPTVLVDYSAMSRMLYLSLLDLLARDWTVVFAYSIGAYGVSPPLFPIAAVGDIRGVPGLEGQPLAHRPKIHVFGLGYDGIGTLALLEKLEAQRIVAFWADPGAVPTSAQIAVDRNRSLIKRADVTFHRDLRDVSGTVDTLRRLAFESTPTDKMLLVPVGPKPHILACGLVAAQNDHVTLLAPHLDGGGIRDNYPSVHPAGEIVVTRVSRKRL